MLERFVVEDVIEARNKEYSNIVGSNKEQVIETINSVDWDSNIEFIYQSEPKGLVHTILVAC